MSLASANLAQMRYILESVYGTTPGAGNGSNLRMTGESLAFGIQTDSSKEIRSDRQTTDVVQTGASASGDVNFELSYKEYDNFLQAALMGTWSTWGTAGVGAVIPTSATFAASTLTAGGATSGNSIFTNLAAGQWVRISGSTIPGQNKIAQVSKTVAPTSTILTFEGTPFTGLTGNGGVAVVVNTMRLTTGTTQRSFTLEKAFTDITQFFAYRGMNANKMSMNFQSGSIVTGAFGFIGKDSVRGAVTTLPGSPAASQTGDVMNAVAGVGNVYEGGSALTGTFIKSLSLDLNNNLRGQSAIGTLGNAGIAPGSIELTGTMEVYLADGTLYDKFIANTASSLGWTVQDGAGQGYGFNLPKVKYSDAKVTAGSLNQDVMLSLPFRALMDATTGVTMIVDRM
jgi:hypothetical protein